MSRDTEFDKAWMDCAVAISKLSRARKKQVGAVIVKDGNIIGVGFNGTPTGFDNICEDKEYYSEIEFKWITRPEVLHAESNAIAKVAKSTQSSEGASLYTTLSPCYDCAKLIIQAGISRVFYTEYYGHPEGIDLLLKAGVRIEEVKG